MKLSCAAAVSATPNVQAINLQVHLAHHCCEPTAERANTLCCCALLTRLLLWAVLLGCEALWLCCLALTVIALWLCHSIYSCVAVCCVIVRLSLWVAAHYPSNPRAVDSSARSIPDESWQCWCGGNHPTSKVDPSPPAAHPSPPENTHLHLPSVACNHPGTASRHCCCALMISLSTHHRNLHRSPSSSTLGVLVSQSTDCISRALSAHRFCL